jgi:hypothetical protein
MNRPFLVCRKRLFYWDFFHHKSTKTKLVVFVNRLQQQERCVDSKSLCAWQPPRYRNILGSALLADDRTKWLLKSSAVAAVTSAVLTLWQVACHSRSHSH